MFVVYVDADVWMHLLPSCAARVDPVHLVCVHACACICVCMCVCVCVHVCAHVCMCLLWWRTVVLFRALVSGFRPCLFSPLWTAWGVPSRPGQQCLRWGIHRQ